MINIKENNEMITEVATYETILKQINSGRLSAMIGAYNWIRHGENVISFRFKMSKKANYCRIEYVQASDLYSVEFKKIGRAPGFTITDVEDFDGVYADQLLKIFESVTGLAVNL